MPEPILMGMADRTVVFRLVNELRGAWEQILNDYAATHPLKTERGGVRYVDAHMAVHNFFKLALDHIVGEARLTGEPAAHFYLGAAETFMMAMRARAEEMRTGRRAGAHPEDPQ